MPRLLLLVLCFAVSSVTMGQNAQQLYAAAKKAEEAKQYDQYYTLIMKAYQLHPYNQYILWNAGIAAKLNNKTDESLDFLSRAINISATFDLNDPKLNSLKTDERFQKLIKMKEMLNRPIVRSDTAVVIQDRQLHLESVAFDPVEKTLYGGSIHKRKIIRIDQRGNASDFTVSEENKMGGVFGLKVDAKRRILWACSSAIPEMQNYDSTVMSTLLQFDLKTGHLIRIYEPQDTSQNHIFGDLVLSSTGTPYVSDSRKNIIYRYNEKTDKLVPFFSSPEFWNLQGLVFSADDKLLYIADYVKGIFILDMQKMVLSKLKTSYDLSLKGTDGILFYKNSLITIQNGVQPNRVVRHFLDPSGMMSTRYDYIDNAHPAFGEPTIGSLDGNKLYYVANSQWGGYENGTIKKEEDLKPIVVLQTNLDQ